MIIKGHFYICPSIPSDNVDRLRYDGWMMDDLGVIIQAGWMIWAATWMMALDDEKKKNVDFR